MKPSEAMLKGFEMAGGNQCRYSNCLGSPKNPKAVCAMGALRLGLTGHSEGKTPLAIVAKDAFYNATGATILEANDMEDMPIPDIAGILAAEGL